MFDTLSHIVVRRAEGIFTADAYAFDERHSSFIPNIDEPTWHRAGFESMPRAEAVEFLAEIFGDLLDGQPLLHDSASHWRQFPHIRNQHWSYRNMLLLGDALRTAHFTIGSGTRLAIEDASVAVQVFEQSSDVGAAFVEFERQRRPLMERLQDIAFESMCWFENIADHADLEILPFVYRMMTRTSGLGPRSLKLTDPEFLGRYESWRRSRESGVS